MIYPDYIRVVLSRARNSGGPLSLACLFLLCPAAAHARQAPPPASQTPPAPPTALVAPAAQTKVKGPARAGTPAPRAPAAMPAQAPSGPTPRPASPRRAPLPVIVPREVVTVVHRLSGWKLLARLAFSGPPELELDEWPAPTDAHTNIVAGYVYEDGRSVVVRLPQAEVELEAFNAPPMPPGFFPPTQSQGKAEPEFMLVTSEGRRVEAKFVGLDSSTGLAMLEASEPLLAGGPATGDTGDTDDPEVGQRVRLYAPIPAVAPAPPAARAAAAVAPPPPQPGRGYIHLSIDQKEGRLTRLVRAPSGSLASVVVSANVSPEWVGAVAANELGEVVGIVSQSRAGETRILSVTSVREACERVMKLRGTVPQPWLGARGDAVAQAPLQDWLNNGWKPEDARTLIAKRQGVFLSSVAPGTPAALAGLRPGDLITSVGPRSVLSNADLSMSLKEAGVGSVVDLTVWRSLAPAPLKLSVELKGAKNPARATAEAEERAQLNSLLGLEREIRELHETESRLRAQAVEAHAVEAHASELERITRRLAVVEERAAQHRQQLERTRERLGTAGLFSVEGAPLLVGPQAMGRASDVTGRLKTYGLHAIGLSSRTAPRLGAQGGLLVVAVQPESPAAVAGLLPGDVIETVNGSPLWRFELRRLTNGPEATTAVLGLVREGRRLKVNFPPAPPAEPRR
ncbi:MAG TPA: PDZ domain-containing protein [Pyrinomonadaceae bacterium]